MSNTIISILRIRVRGRISGSYAASLAILVVTKGRLISDSCVVGVVGVSNISGGDVWRETVGLVLLVRCETTCC
jgi:hypothetical protein